MPSVVSYSISTSNHNRVDAPVSVPFVVSYSISTSNHNLRSIFCFAIIVVSYSISTSNHNSMLGFTNCVIVVSYSISTSNHNITHYLLHIIEVVSYSISTSNHNNKLGNPLLVSLYLIPFLHQTTTAYTSFERLSSCILFHFYIKPQPVLLLLFAMSVVSYSISTSNHNYGGPQAYHQGLYLIPFLHQTTTYMDFKASVDRCILFHFYIKPQPMAHKTLFSSTLSPKSHSHFQRNAVV